MALYPKVRIYIAGPLTIGDVEQNVKNAIRAGNEIREAGYYPFIPHLFYFWDKEFHHEYDSWLDLDMEWLSVCHAMLRLPGKSAGADLETKRARKIGIPVFDNMSDVINWADDATRNRYLDEAVFYDYVRAIHEMKQHPGSKLSFTADGKYVVTWSDVNE